MVGEITALARARQAIMYEMLKRLGAERGIKVIGVPKVLHGDERVSSSRIRRCLLERIWKKQTGC